MLTTGAFGRILALAACWLWAGHSAIAVVELPPSQSAQGFLARLLINEAPFPGEHGYVSESDSRAAMEAILLTLHARSVALPKPYTRMQVADTNSANILDVITAGGVRGQVDGFYREANGQLAMVPRVHERIQYLTGIAGQGKPGRFARLLNYAVAISNEYFAGELRVVDRFGNLTYVGGTPVTGGSYAWMTNHPKFHPKGYFVKIPDRDYGALGGNRFFTLKRIEQ
ncbi:hypothetical protein [Cerasicoccus frondis]|uniref:hypothetical protein n=1 Tax=Cerasicoccus frondis TaxID=490090 RepID=UPI002852790D|nr:hypothetical protein [Cerasicoccus frondis]